ncbi:MAG: (2Fe-2S)-binding protein [Actinopolymorphaceae bacterium]
MDADREGLLTEMEELGEYFTVVTVPHVQSDPPLAELYAGHPDLLDYVHQVTESLRTHEQRVGASILVQGLAARLWSVVVGSGLLSDRVPDLAPATTWWAPHRSGGRLRLLAPTAPTAPTRASDAGRGDPSAIVAEVHHGVVETHLVGLIPAIRTHVNVPDALLWGNAASALVGSVGVLLGARPDLEAAGGRLVDTLLARPPLEGTGEVSTPTGFVRTSCCLYYRVPGGGLCGDCPLDRQPVR